jgi:hypothetical protein
MRLDSVSIVVYKFRSVVFVLPIMFLFQLRICKTWLFSLEPLKCESTMSFLLRILKHTPNIKSSKTLVHL